MRQEDDVTPQDFPFKIVHSCKSIFIIEAKKDFEMKLFLLLLRSLAEQKKFYSQAILNVGYEEMCFFIFHTPKDFSFLLRFASNWTDARDFLAKATLESFEIKNILNDVSLCRS